MQRTRLLNQVANLLASQRAASDAINRMGSAFFKNTQGGKERSGGLMAVTAVLPTNTGRPAFDALVVFSTWYPIGVMLLVFASRPLGRL